MVDTADTQSGWGVTQKLESQAVELWIHVKESTNGVGRGQFLGRKCVGWFDREGGEG